MTTRCPECEAIAARDAQASHWLLEHLYRKTAELHHGRMLLVDDCAKLPHRDDPFRL